MYFIANHCVIHKTLLRLLVNNRKSTNVEVNFSLRPIHGPHVKIPMRTSCNMTSSLSNMLMPYKSITTKLNAHEKYTKDV